MPSTTQALLVLVVAVLPGLLYVLSFERVVGSWGVALADRLLRFVAVSAVFHAALAPVAHTTYRRYHDGFAGRVVPPWVWLVTALYVGLPLLAGSVVGTGYRRGRDWARVLAGDGAAPRAWDWLWTQRPRGVLRLRLKSGEWIAGRFDTRADGRRSYAAGYPEEGDLYISRGVVVDPLTGQISVDDRGWPVESGYSILVRWSEVEYLDLKEEELP